MARKFNRKKFALYLFLAVFIGLFVLLPKLSMLGFKPPKPPAELPDEVVIVPDTEWKNILDAASGPPLGKAKTPYTMVEFGDFQCAPCFSARPLLEAQLNKYPDKVNMLFVHRPLPKAHQFAIAAANFAQLAAGYGKFWQTYDYLYEHHNDIEPGFYQDYAVKLGMTVAQFNDPAMRKVAEGKVTKAKELSNRLELKTTPSLVIRDNKTKKLTTFVGLDAVKLVCANGPWAPSATVPAEPAAALKAGGAPPAGATPQLGSPLSGAGLPPQPKTGP